MQTVSNTVRFCIANSELGYAEARGGDLDGGEMLCEMALRGMREQGATTHEAYLALLLRIGKIKLWKKQAEQALDFFDEVLACCQATENSNDRPLKHAQVGAAVALWMIGQRQAAASLHRQLLAAIGSDEDLIEERAELEIGCAEIAAANQHWDEAERWLALADHTCRSAGVRSPLLAERRNMMRRCVAQRRPLQWIVGAHRVSMPHLRRAA